MSQEKRVELVGGPNHGKFVPYVGPVYREPVVPSQRASWVGESSAPTATPTEYAEYETHTWRTNFGKYIQRYVLRRHPIDSYQVVERGMVRK